MNEYTVYRHTNKINGRVYIGITCRPVEERWKNGRHYKTSHYFYRAIQKYGWDGFEHEILFTGLSKEIAQDKEIELIAFYRNSECGCYNILQGGNLSRTGMPLSSEAKEKLRQVHLGAVRSEECRKKLSEANKGKVMSEESKRKMSENNARYWQGKRRSPETNEKIRQAQLGKKHSAETKAKMSAAHIGMKRKNPFTKEHLEAISRSTRKAVLQMELDGTPVKEWLSMRDAADALGKKYINRISMCCRGQTPVAYGYKWKIINNEGE